MSKHIVERISELEMMLSKLFWFTFHQRESMKMGNRWRLGRKRVEAYNQADFVKRRNNQQKKSRGTTKQLIIDESVFLSSQM